MTTKTVDIAEAQTHLPDLLSLVSSGVEVVFTKGSTPIARLVAMESSTAPRLPGLHLGAIQTSDDFDEPLPDALWTGET